MKEALRLFHRGKKIDTGLAGVRRDVLELCQHSGMAIMDTPQLAAHERPSARCFFGNGDIGSLGFGRCRLHKSQTIVEKRRP